MMQGSIKMFDDDRYTGLENFGVDYFQQQNGSNNFDKEYDSRQYSNTQRFNVMPNNTQQNNQYNGQYNNQNMQNSYYPTNDDYANNYANSQQFVNQNTAATYNVMVCSPKNFSELQESIKALRSNQTVILEVSRVDNEIIQRLMDYMSGAIFALGGSIQRISQGMFLLTPKDVKIRVPVDIAKKLGDGNNK